MEKKDPCAVFGCNNDRLFPEKYTVKDHISNTKLKKGEEKKKENFKKKCPEKRSKIQTKCAHAPWASYNTPSLNRLNSIWPPYR